MYRLMRCPIVKTIRSFTCCDLAITQTNFCFWLESSHIHHDKIDLFLQTTLIKSRKA